MEKIFVVHLRQPNNKSGEMRTDPFWEFGSFGLTGCHSNNLLHNNNCYTLDGNKLAFSQNGKEGFKLILLTPRVDVIKHKYLNEVIWDKNVRPFKYDKAPLLVNNNCESDFPLLLNSIRKVRRNTCISKFSSAFRSRCFALEDEIANEVLIVFNSKYKKSNESNFVSNYIEALPYLPPLIDKNRKSTYKRLLLESNKGSDKVNSKCRKC